jgi:prepilin-type processing-associated H-X9-DG protein
MKSQRIKDLYFSVMAPVAMASHSFWRRRLRKGIPRSLGRGETGRVWLNLGSGANPHPRLINIDGNAFRRPDMWLDLRQGLPFPPGTVDSIYACHMLEHFFWNEVISLLQEASRVLKSGGWMRVLVPSLELAVDAYVRKDADWFPDFPTRFASLGGKFANFLFCDGQHRLGFDLSLMEEAFHLAGFRSVHHMKPRSSHWLPNGVLAELEPPVGHIDSSLVVEAQK